MMNDFDRMSQQSSISKKSKWQDIECPHFKNGGKCINCINKWKAEHRKH